MKSYVRLVLAGLAFSVVAAMPARAATKEVVIYSSEEMIEFAAGQFNKKYPNIKVRVVNGNSGELIARIVAEGGRPQGDVLWGGGSAELMHPKLFRPVGDLDISAIDKKYPKNELKVPIQTYAGIYLVNMDALKGDKAPTTWAELGDPKWKGRFYFGNPITSNAAFTMMLAWYQIGGWDLVKKIAANAVITPGSVDPVRAAGNGEATVGTGAERSVYQWADGKKVVPVYPKDGVIMMFGDMYILKGAPNEENAKTFVNFMLSADAQTNLSKEFQGTRPTNAQAITSSALVPPGELKILEVPAEVNTNRQAWIDKWKQIISSLR